MDLLDFIKKTNGDLLGVFLFTLLIIYFMMLDNKTPSEYLLLFGCIIGFIVDSYICITELKK